MINRDLTAEEVGADYESLQRNIELTAEHWTTVLGRPVSIEFARRQRRSATGYVVTEDYYDGPDDYRLEVRVEGFTALVFSLLDAEKYLERVWG